MELAAAAGRTLLTGADVTSAVSLNGLSISKPLRLMGAAATGRAESVLQCTLLLPHGGVELASVAADGQPSAIHVTGSIFRGTAPAAASSRRAPQRSSAPQLLAALNTATVGCELRASSPKQPPAQAVVQRALDRAVDGFWLHPAAFDSALQLGQLGGSSPVNQGKQSKYHRVISL